MHNPESIQENEMHTDYQSRPEYQAWRLSTKKRVPAKFPDSMDNSENQRMLKEK